MDLSLFLKALSDPTRLELVRLLLQQQLCVGALAKRLGVSEPAVSQHIKILRAADLIFPEKKGHFIHYQVNRETLLAAAEHLEALARTPRKPCCHGCHAHSKKEAEK